MTPTDSSWYDAEVLRVADETPCTKTFTFRLPHPVRHLPGQHYELRLTAPDGYQAARLYSASSAATGDDTVQLTIAHIVDGEVSPYLHHHVKVGDRVELRGPLGRSFVWNPADAAPVLLLAGGVGVSPFRAMLQAHKQAGSKATMRLLWSCRGKEEIIFGDELLGSPAVTVTLTRNWPPDWPGETGRITADVVMRLLGMYPGRVMCYVCGMTSFVEAAGALLLAAGVMPAYIRAERFGS
ncbi:MAG TPA: FAD-binding oxidoreductase [Candidatus Saccharimonadales bacterium]|nr:FAD-binding oxidoreductase [Candidatus Saccharimonadales bacterium]